MPPPGILNGNVGANTKCFAQGLAIADSAATSRSTSMAPDSLERTLSPASITNTGGSQPHNNMMPYLVLNFIIALQGMFPSRN